MTCRLRPRLDGHPCSGPFYPPGCPTDANTPPDMRAQAGDSRLVRVRAVVRGFADVLQSHGGSTGPRRDDRKRVGGEVELPAPPHTKKIVTLKKPSHTIKPPTSRRHVRATARCALWHRSCRDCLSCLCAVKG